MTRCIGDNTVVEFVEGTLGAQAAAVVERHVGSCEACRLRVVAIGTSPSRLANAPTPPTGIGAHLLLQPGTRVDRFVILHRLGHGGMGVVFAAFDPELRRRVALKLLRSASEDQRPDEPACDKLLDEARIMASLHHEHIVTVHETGTFRDEPYLVMELVQGVTLNAWLRRWGERSTGAVLAAFQQAGSALAHAHAHGLAHGDFKPENVLVDEGDRVRVTDFGLARHFDPAVQSTGSPTASASRPAMVMGTPRYMAPEQYRGTPADARSDQFSFCVALFEALFGRHPCVHENPRSILERPAEQVWVEVPSNTDVSDRVIRALSKGLQPNPSARYPSMNELLAALRPRPWTSDRRRVAGAATAALLAACVLGFAIGHESAGDPPTRPAPPGAAATEVPTPASPGHQSAPANPMDANDIRSPGQGSSADAKHWQQVYGNAMASSAPLTMLKSVHQFLEDETARLAIRLERQRRRPSTTELTELTRDVARIEQVQADQALRIAKLEQEQVPRARPRPAKRSRTARRGLSSSALRASIAPRLSDLRVCFREWRERSTGGRNTLTVYMEVDRHGRARPSGYRGLSDQVVRKCTAGALVDARYPKHRRSSWFAVRFRSDDSGLRMKIRPDTVR